MRHYIALLLVFLPFGFLNAREAVAQELELHPFAYEEGFEGDCPQLALWASDGTSAVATSGPSEEQAFEGKRSYKLDVTLDGGSYHYFGVPVRVPCAGTVKLSARVRVAEGTTARVGFGTNMVYPPTRHSGCGSADSFSEPTDTWKLVEIDLAERGATGAAAVMDRVTGTVRGEDVGAYLDRWSLFIYGGAGKRAIVYLDDVRIEGEAPTEADYDADIDRRWQQNQARLAERIADWRTQIAEAGKAFDALPPAPEPVQNDVESIRNCLGKATELVDKFAAAGYGARDDVTAIESALYTLRYGPETISAMAEGVNANQPFLLYSPPAITNMHFATDTFPIPARVATGLSCAGCAGEYESMALAVFAIQDLKQVRLTVSDLEGTAGIIPSAAVDLYTVKSWFQAGRGIGFQANTRLYVPELLLKDDQLVRVDMEKQENYLRSTNEDGTQTYLLCSGPASENLDGVRPADASDLQPVDVPSHRLRLFWITVHIPEEAATGTYTGTIAITSETGARSIPIEVTVHSFGLLPSKVIHSIYYRAKLSRDGNPTIGSETKSETQYRAELEDMKAHGVLYPTNYQGFDETLLRRVLELRQETGLPTARFYNLGLSTGRPTDSAQLAALTENVEKWVAFVQGFGYRDVYFYGIDEATGETLKAQQTAWRTVQEAGGKTFVACYSQTFETMGALLNCAVLAGRPDPEEARKWHSVGSEAFCYANPQVGVEEPETYRRNFGLVLWKVGFDGAMDYAYQHGFGHVWNDFDHPTYRDHNFTYPTIDGVVGTIQWEGYREGVDDLRYIATLEQAIETAPPAKADTAAEARRWLENLDPDTADLDEARAQMARLIAALTASDDARQ